MPYLPYEEPGITTILSLTSFLLLLNIVRCILDHLLYCGIIGEILIGIIWAGYHGFRKEPKRPSSPTVTWVS